MVGGLGPGASRGGRFWCVSRLAEAFCGLGVLGIWAGIKMFRVRRLQGGYVLRLKGI